MTHTWAATFVVVVVSSVLLESAGAAPTDARGLAADRPAAWPAEVAPELRRIQRELGGSVVQDFAPWRSEAPRSEERRRSRTVSRYETDADRADREAMDALRDAAAELDVAANKLERFELYEQADGLRAQAQRLRLDARRLRGGEREGSRVEPMLPTPQLQTAPTPTQPQLAPGAEEPERVRGDRPAIGPAPSGLEPAPLRE